MCEEGAEDRAEWEVRDRKGHIRGESHAIHSSHRSGLSITAHAKMSEETHDTSVIMPVNKIRHLPSVVVYKHFLLVAIDI